MLSCCEGKPALCQNFPNMQKEHEQRQPQQWNLNAQLLIPLNPVGSLYPASWYTLTLCMDVCTYIYTHTHPLPWNTTSPYPIPLKKKKKKILSACTFRRLGKEK